MAIVTSSSSSSLIDALWKQYVSQSPLCTVRLTAAADDSSSHANNGKAAVLVHAAIVDAACPSLLESAGASSSNLSIVRLHGVTAKALPKLVACMYGRGSDELVLEPGLAVELLAALEAYDMAPHAVSAVCNEAEAQLSTADCLSVWVRAEAARRYSASPMTSLAAAAGRFCAKKYDLFAEECGARLPTHLLTRLLSSHDLRLPDRGHGLHLLATLIAHLDVIIDNIKEREREEKKKRRRIVLQEAGDDDARKEEAEAATTPPATALEALVLAAPVRVNGSDSTTSLLVSLVRAARLPLLGPELMQELLSHPRIAGDETLHKAAAQAASATLSKCNPKTNPKKVSSSSTSTSSSSPSVRRGGGGSGRRSSGRDLPPTPGSPRPVTLPRQFAVTPPSSPRTLPRTPDQAQKLVDTASTAAAAAAAYGSSSAGGGLLLRRRRSSCSSGTSSPLASSPLASPRCYRGSSSRSSSSVSVSGSVASGQKVVTPAFADIAVQTDAMDSPGVSSVSVACQTIPAEEIVTVVQEPETQLPPTTARPVTVAVPSTPALVGVLHDGDGNCESLQHTQVRPASAPSISPAHCDGPTENASSPIAGSRSAISSNIIDGDTYVRRGGDGGGGGFRIDVTTASADEIAAFYEDLVLTNISSLSMSPPNSVIRTRRMRRRKKSSGGGGGSGSGSDSGGTGTSTSTDSITSVSPFTSRSPADGTRSSGNSGATSPSSPEIHSIDMGSGHEYSPSSLDEEEVIEEEEEEEEGPEENKLGAHMTLGNARKLVKDAAAKRAQTGGVIAANTTSSSGASGATIRAAAAGIGGLDGIISLEEGPDDVFGDFEWDDLSAPHPPTAMVANMTMATAAAAVAATTTATSTSSNTATGSSSSSSIRVDALNALREVTAGAATAAAVNTAAGNVHHQRQRHKMNEEEDQFASSPDREPMLIVVGGTGMPGMGRSVQRLQPGARVWAPAASTILPRAAFGSAVWRDRLVVFGGAEAYGSGEMYDPNTDTWTTICPSHACAPGCAAAAVGASSIFVCGGLGTDGQARGLSIYDPETNCWHEGLPPPPYPRAYHTCVSDTGRFIMCGGMSPAHEVLASVTAFDPLTDAWMPLPPLATPRMCHAAALSDGHLYVLGGVDSKGGALCSVERINLSDPNAAWEAVTDLPHARQGAAALHYNGRLCLLGGYSGEDINVHDADCVLAYNSLARTWTYSNPGNFAQDEEAKRHRRLSRDGRRSQSGQMLFSSLGVRDQLCAAVLPMLKTSIAPDIEQAARAFEGDFGSVNMPSGARSVFDLIEATAKRSGATAGASLETLIMSDMTPEAARVRALLKWLMEEGLVYQTIDDHYRPTLDLELND